MEGQFHGRAFPALAFKRHCILAHRQPEEIWVVGVMEHLVTHRRQQPALHRRRSRSQPIKEKGIIADIHVLETMLTVLGVVPDQVSVPAGNCLHLHIHRRAVIDAGAGDVQEEILTVLPGKGQVIADISRFQFKERHFRLA